jgi:hypothetical protein
MTKQGEDLLNNQDMTPAAQPQVKIITLCLKNVGGIKVVSIDSR